MTIFPIMIFNQISNSFSFYQFGLGSELGCPIYCKDQKCRKRFGGRKCVLLKVRNQNHNLFPKKPFLKNDNRYYSRRNGRVSYVKNGSEE